MRHRRQHPTEHNNGTDDDDTGSQWAESKDGVDAGYPVLFKAFQSTTSHGMLTSVTASLAGRHVYLRFKCATGEKVVPRPFRRSVLAFFLW